jgi:hypothetical protein
MMWRDIGLGEWLFDFDREEELERLPGVVLEMVREPGAARERAAKAREMVRVRQREMAGVLRQQLPQS